MWNITIAEVVLFQTLTSNRPRPTSLSTQHSRSYQPSAVPDDDASPTTAASLVTNEVFIYHDPFCLPGILLSCARTPILRHSQGKA